MAPHSDSSRELIPGLDMEVMEQLLELDDGGVGLLKEMAGLFREDTPERIQALEATLAAGNLAALADVAHAIKGAAGTMGITRLRAVAAELEGGGRKGTFSAEPGSLVEQLKRDYAEGLAALDGFIAQRES